MNLGDVWVDADADDAAVWAAQHEFDLRQRRYEFFRMGGLVGAVKRWTEAHEHLLRAIFGSDAEDRSETGG